MAETNECPARAAPLPRWRTVLYWVAGAGMLGGAFFVPQGVPLEWYPLNEPGTDINYLEIKCASNADGWVQIFIDATHGLTELDSIKWPISPTEQTYTYTFPLLDAPLVGLRLDPVEKGGTLTVDECRIINRRGELIRRFTQEMLAPIHEVAAIGTIRTGWTVTSTADSRDPMVGIDLNGTPIIPVGMNHRNLQRCLLSTGYLAGMLTILMLAVVTAFWKPASWGDFARKVGLVAAISIPLAAIGNRGLIRNSIRYAQFQDPAHAVPALELELETDRTVIAQLFWDVGNGLREEDSATRKLYAQSGQKSLHFPLPQEPVRSLRLDPHVGACVLRVTAIRLVGRDRQIRATLPLDSLQPTFDIASCRLDGTALVIETTANASDPSLMITSSAIPAINRAQDSHANESSQRP